MITKTDLRLVFGSLENIGALFPPDMGGPIGKSAVAQWTEKIPRLREYQLRELHPDIDQKIAAARAKAATAGDTGKGVDTCQA